jgi:hypothetical protein
MVPLTATGRGIERGWEELLTMRDEMRQKRLVVPFPFGSDAMTDRL